MIALGGTVLDRGAPRCSRSGRAAAAPASRSSALIAARDALRGARRRARLRGRVPARRAAGAARARVPAAREAARSREAPAAPRVLAAAAAIAALIVAPALDGATPVVGLRELGAVDRRRRSRPASPGTTTTARCDWPRDGRELLRVKAQAARLLEGRATSTSSTAGAGARRAPARARRPSTSCPARPGRGRRWTQTIEVNVRNLRTRTFVTARHRGRRADRCRDRAAIPTGRRHLVRRAARCGAATPTGRGLHAAADRPRAARRRHRTTTRLRAALP